MKLFINRQPQHHAFKSQPVIWPLRRLGRLGMLVMVFSLLSLHGKAMAAEQADSFATRVLHLSFRPQVQSPAFYKGVIDQASKLGYNTFILNTGGIFAASYTIPKPGEVRFLGWTDEQVAELFDYAKQAGLEPIFEVKIIAKHKALLPELAKKHSGLLISKAKGHWRNGVLNPAYRFPDGKDAYDAVEFPMIDHFIALHGKTPPRYMLLGMDEVPVDDLQVCAKAMNTTVAKLFAKLLNRCAEHLLEKDITPIFWGDMFLSKRLSKPGHGVIGFDHDSRIKHGHATFLSTQKPAPSVLTAMNDLKNRDKIIIADWHYMPLENGAYPSVDYFQAMGFKDIWGATWYNDKGIRQFCQYAAKRQCAGMIATVWHTSISPAVRHLFQPLLNNSAVYFRNPNFNPPPLDLTYRLAPTQEKDTFAAATQQQTGVFLGATPTLYCQVQLPENQYPAPLPVLLISHDQSRKSPPLTMPLTYDPKAHRLTGSLSLPQSTGTPPHTYSTALRWINRDSGYLHQIYRPSHFSVTHRPPAQAGTADQSTWFAADFSGLLAEALASRLIYTAGQFPLLLQVERPVEKTKPINGALNCRAASGWCSNPKNLWDRIATQGMQLDITFKVTGSFKKRAHCAVMSFGHYSSGFRLLMAKDNTLLLQFANQDGGKPIWITSPVKLLKNQWTSVRITLTPASNDQLRVTTLTIDNHEPVITTLPNPIHKHNESPLGLGVEFRPHGSMAKTWENFPGLIQKITLKPYATSH